MEGLTNPATDSLERLKGLHADLIAFSETRLANIDRLWQELEDSIQEFRTLLDKPLSTSSAREEFNTGKITIDDQQYSINDDFRHLSRAVGTVLTIDEEIAARLIIQTQTAGPIEDEENLVIEVVSNFHDRRDLLLQSLRISLEQSINLDHEEQLRAPFQDIVAQTLDIRNGPPSNGSAYASKCLKAMEDIELWQNRIHEQIQSKAILSQARGQAFYATLDFQSDSLAKQHEALGAILMYLFKANYTNAEDLRKLHNVFKKWQRMDVQWVHYLPAFGAAFQQYGAPETSPSADQAKSLNNALTESLPDTFPSVLRPYASVLNLWWVAHYSGYFREIAGAGADAEKRARLVKTALDDGALDFMVSLCSHVQTSYERHPARDELVALLLEETTFTFEGAEQTSPFFAELLMEAIESFAEAWITNMPDSIRKLKTDEDEERLSYIAGLQDRVAPSQQRGPAARLHLEAFLVLIAFAFERRAEAAEHFWEDPDGNLYGFMQWASRRQTVPRVSAFCEMLCAISQSSESAEAAHKFLLDESVAVPSARGRRLPTMNYQQMFAELGFYSRKVHDRSPVPQLPNRQGAQEPDLSEAESPIMLSCYLRLLAHLCRFTPSTRHYVLSIPDSDFAMMLLTLSAGPIPSFLRANVFAALDALLTDKDLATTGRIWNTLDLWASTALDRGAAAGNAAQPPSPTGPALQSALASISTSPDQCDAFVMLLNSLVAPIPEPSSQSLPFPTDLGSNYRSPGITPYVDFICAQITSRRVQELSEDVARDGLLRLYHCVDFVARCLEGFNEHYVTKFDRLPGGESDFATVYRQRHPFARVMQWIFSVDMNKALLSMLHASTESVASAPVEAPLVRNLQRCIDIVNLVIEYQPTYFDLVKPVVKDVDSRRTVRFSGITAIEESFAGQPRLILDLCNYAAAIHLQLSLRSLLLLQKLSRSAKLEDRFSTSAPLGAKAGALLDMVGPAGEIETVTIANALISQFAFNVRELEDGFDAPGYLLKDGVMAFLNSCLSTQASKPTLAHLLLGYARISGRLILSSQMDEGVSLFNALVDLSSDYPDGQDGSLVSWLLHVKAAAIGVLRLLWTSSASSSLTLGQLRRLNFLTSQISRQTVVSRNTLWDRHSVLESGFWYTTSAEALAEFFDMRASLYDYVKREVQSLAVEQLKSLQQRLLATLQGRSVDVDGTSFQHATIFDLLDFAEMDVATSLTMPDLVYFGQVDFETYRLDEKNAAPGLYDISGVQAVLNVLSAHVTAESAQGNKSIDLDLLSYESDGVVGLLEARNRFAVARRGRITALQSFVEMFNSVIQHCPMEASLKTTFILQMLQLFLPKLDVYLADEAPEAVQLARAADTMLYALASEDGSSKTSTSRTDIIFADKLFQLFRISIEGISLSTANTELRTTLYSICTQFLTQIVTSPTKGGEKESDTLRRARSMSMDCVRSAGSRLLTTIADDAEDGADACRRQSLDLLASLTLIARREKSSLVIDTLIKANILEVLMDPVRHVVTGLQNSAPQLRAHLLTVFESRTIFLLQVSQTRSGATALLDAGLVSALRDSMIFRADPDIGMDINGNSTSFSSSSLDTVDTNAPFGRSIAAATASMTSTAALHSYFVLLSSCLRLLLSTFVSIGLQNEKIMYIVQTFLRDYRANMVGVYKRALGIGGKTSRDVGVDSALQDCVRSYTALVAGSGFAEYEDDTPFGGAPGAETATSGGFLPGAAPGLGRSGYGFS